MKKPMTPDDARDKVEAICSRAEYCQADIRERLRRWGLTVAETEHLIEKLVDDRFINDARFARAFVRDKYRFAGWGRGKIKVALMQKRISGTDIDEALEEIDSREYQMKAFAVMSAKLRSVDRTDIRQCRERLFRFGVQRGYETRLVTRIINSSKLWES